MSTSARLKNMDGMSISSRVSKFLKICLVLSALFPLRCTNYTVSRIQTIPPILLSLTQATTGGYILVYRGTNPEIFFAGYKLYIGASANEARNPTSLFSGIDCTSRALLPNLPIEYSIEINQTSGLSTVNAGENANRVCKFQTSLTPGTYISLRTLLLSFQVGSQGFQYSAPSNALVVP